VLVYSLELFRGVLPDEHYAYWELFVEACRLTELPSLTSTEITQIKDAWRAHNASYIALYGHQNFLSKHHELSHEDARIDTGPSHVTHCFMVTSADCITLSCVPLPSTQFSFATLSLLALFFLSLSLSRSISSPALSLFLLSRLSPPTHHSVSNVHTGTRVGLTPFAPPLQMEMQNGIAASVNDNGRNPQLSIMRWITQRHRLVNVILKFAATGIDLVTSPTKQSARTACYAHPVSRNRITRYALPVLPARIARHTHPVAHAHIVFYAHPVSPVSLGSEAE
jgi:hypothetical protein